MNFSKKQKTSLIFSIWLFFLWIVVISLSTRVDFQGNLLDCIGISIIGMVIASFLYLLVFVDKYLVSKTLCEEENVKRIKSMKRTAYIILIYIDIVGFFLMTLSALLIDSHKYAVMPAWVFAAATFVFLCVSFIRRYKKISVASRTLVLQEQNREICQK